MMGEMKWGALAASVGMSHIKKILTNPHSAFTVAGWDSSFLLTAKRELFPVLLARDYSKYPGPTFRGSFRFRTIAVNYPDIGYLDPPTQLAIAMPKVEELFGSFANKASLR